MAKMKINEEYLKKQVFEVCSDYIHEDDIVIGILRYGAHIPHIYQNICRENSIQPKPINLLLSHMLPFFPREYYQNKNIILLDDTIYSGHELERLKSDLITIFGVPETNIHTIALVVHEDSKIMPDFPEKKTVLKNAEYVAWKEILGSLVAEDIRPTERDHPLYFLETDNMEIGRFLDILQNYGQLHSIGTYKSKVLKISLTVDSNNLAKEINLTGVDLGEIYKIRIFWRKSNSGAKFTAVPMGFPVVNLDEFIESKSSRELARMVGVEETFFEDIHSSCHEDFCQLNLFYFASRSIYALLLERLLKQAVPVLNGFGYHLNLLDPREMDGPVNYLFPDAYNNFYSAVSEKLLDVIKIEPAHIIGETSDVWKKPQNSFVPSQIDSLLPSPYRILSFLAKNLNPAKWDGKKWIPNYANLDLGKSFHEILSEFNDPMFVSKSLDYLLESGLLRAKDLPLPGVRNCFTRTFLPGGEYNAIRVNRVAHVLDYKTSFNYNPLIAEEEAIELWGPY